jgi:hypothetical protein
MYNRDPRSYQHASPYKSNFEVTQLRESGEVVISYSRLNRAGVDPWRLK